MKKFLLSAIFLTITYSQAGMFDQLTNLISSETTKSETVKEENGLISSITKNIGLTPTQATSGTATILQYAKNQVSDTDYTSLLKNVPALGNLGSSSLTDNLLGSVSSLESVQTAFKTLGIDPSLISQFVPLIIEYAKSVGGVDSQDILTGALKGLL